MDQSPVPPNASGMRNSKDLKILECFIVWDRTRSHDPFILHLEVELQQTFSLVASRFSPHISLSFLLSHRGTRRFCDVSQNRQLACLIWELPELWKSLGKAEALPFHQKASYRVCLSLSVTIWPLGSQCRSSQHSISPSIKYQDMLGLWPETQSSKHGGRWSIQSKFKCGMPLYFQFDMPVTRKLL